MSTSRPYHHGDLRAALLRAAQDVLADGGADALSLRAVARRAGVSPMAPYRHYPDKEALLAAVAELGFAGLADVLRHADARPGGGLVAQAVAYVRYALDHPAMFRLMFGPKRLCEHPGLQAASSAAYGVLASRVDADNPEDADTRALGCWAMVHGLACLFLDGRIAPSGEDDLTRQIATAMLPPLSQRKP